MPPFAQLGNIVAFLRSEIPAQDISANPVVAHPHNTSRLVRKEETSEKGLHHSR